MFLKMEYLMKINTFLLLLLALSSTVFGGPLRVAGGSLIVSQTSPLSKEIAETNDVLLGCPFDGKKKKKKKKSPVCKSTNSVSVPSSSKAVVDSSDSDSEDEEEDAERLWQAYKKCSAESEQARKKEAEEAEAKKQQEEERIRAAFEKARLEAIQRKRIEEEQRQKEQAQKEAEQRVQALFEAAKAEEQRQKELAEQEAQAAAERVQALFDAAKHEEERIKREEELLAAARVSALFHNAELKELEQAEREKEALVAAMRARLEREKEELRQQELQAQQEAALRVQRQEAEKLRLRGAMHDELKQVVQAREEKQFKAQQEKEAQARLEQEMRAQEEAKRIEQERVSAQLRAEEEQRVKRQEEKRAKKEEEARRKERAKQEQDHLNAFYAAHVKLAKGGPVFARHPETGDMGRLVMQSDGDAVWVISSEQERINSEVAAKEKEKSERLAKILAAKAGATAQKTSVPSASGGASGSSTASKEKPKASSSAKKPKAPVSQKSSSKKKNDSDDDALEALLQNTADNKLQEIKQYCAQVQAFCDKIEGVNVFDKKTAAELKQYKATIEFYNESLAKNKFSSDKADEVDDIRITVFSLFVKLDNFDSKVLSGKQKAAKITQEREGMIELIQDEYDRALILFRKVYSANNSDGYQEDIKALLKKLYQHLDWLEKNRSAVGGQIETLHSAICDLIDDLYDL